MTKIIDNVSADNIITFEELENDAWFMGTNGNEVALFLKVSSCEWVEFNLSSGVSKISDYANNGGFPNVVKIVDVALSIE